MNSSSSSQKLRLFAAISLSEAAVEACLKLQTDLQSKLSHHSIKWTRRDQLHLTLKFFGAVPQEKVTELVTQMASATRNVGIFNLRLSSTGFFPNPQRSRVFWLGLDGDLAMLQQLHQSLETATATFGDHAEDREFHPHITLARISDARAGRALVETVREKNPSLEASWKVFQVKLIQSHLHPSGSRYEVLEQLLLP